MNSMYFGIPEELQNEFREYFIRDNNDNDDSNRFNFFRKFIVFVENDVSSFNHLILLENPLKNMKYFEFMKSMNDTCKEFLESKSQLPDESDTRKTLGNAFCYKGTAYEHGLFGYKKDFISACENYLISSRLNNSFGTYKLAQCYEKGKGTERDANRALYFYRCAAKLGLTDALHVYGMLLAKGGLGAEIDEKTGLHFLSLASVQSDKIYPYAQFDIGKWYETVKEGLDVNVDEKYAFDIFMRGAKLNDPNCQFRIAACFDKGQLGAPKDLEKAAFWYHRAAEGGHIEAQMILADFYRTGLGNRIKRDLKASYFWILEAGTRGCSRAVLYLGEYSMGGSGLKPDILLAMWWFMISAEMGLPEAKVKYEETKKEVERLDDGPQIPNTCCGFFCCNQI